jgi:hypothetical protein
MPSCGGDGPTGTWSVQGACDYQAALPYQQMSLMELMASPWAPSLVPPQPEPTTQGDWCSMLLFAPPSSADPTGAVKMGNLWHDAPLIQGGTLAFNADQTYKASLTFSTKSQTHLAASCLTSGGAQPTCDQLAQSFTTFYESAAMAQGAAGAMSAMSAYQGITCAPDHSGGCTCAYTYQVELDDQGTWLVDQTSGTLSVASGMYLLNGQRVESQAPTQALPMNFCRDGATLTLSGANGNSLFAAVGLRAITLQAM